MATVEEARARGEYPGTVVVAAVLATLFFPLLSLIAALVLLGGERAGRKRGQLRTWAWASGGWIVLQVVVAIVVAVAIWSGSDATSTNLDGPCVGGPVPGGEATVDEQGRAVFPCSISGSETVPLP